MEETLINERMRIREKQADITNGKNSPFITMDRRVWLDYADEVKEIEEILRTFENQPTMHMLRLIAKDMQGNGTHQDVKRSRGNWLMRFVRAFEEKR